MKVLTEPLSRSSGTSVMSHLKGFTIQLIKFESRSGSTENTEKTSAIKSAVYMSGIINITSMKLF